MKTFKQLRHLQRIHKLIKHENTGNPKMFADKLNISERKLYNLLNHLKGLDAPLHFNRKSNTYCYSKNFDLLVHVSVQVIVGDELKTIYAGSIILRKNFFTARLM